MTRNRAPVRAGRAPGRPALPAALPAASALLLCPNIPRGASGLAAGTALPDRAAPDDGAAAGIEVPDLPTDLEVLQRHGEDGTRYVVVLNHTEQEQHLTVPGTDQEVGVGAGADDEAHGPILWGQSPTANFLQRSGASMTRSATSTPPRIHPAWWVAAVAFLALLGAAGFRAAPGALMVPLHEEFGWSMSTMSLSVGINLLLYGLVAPFAAALMERFGMRQIIAGALTLVALGAGGSTLMTASWQLHIFWGVLIGTGTGSMALVLAATGLVLVRRVPRAR